MMQYEVLENVKLKAKTKDAYLIATDIEHDYWIPCSVIKFDDVLSGFYGGNEDLVNDTGDIVVQVWWLEKNKLL